MNYLTDLTKEEINYICSVIPYKETVEYFKRHPKEFTRLRPGFRAKSLDETMVARTLFDFRKNPFISSFLTTHIDIWIKQIDEELTKVKEAGLNQEKAYIHVLSQSYFSGNIALFFKIKGEVKTEDYLLILSNAVEFEAERQSDNEEKKKLLKKKNADLIIEREELQKQLTEGEKKIEEFKKCEDELNGKLEQASQVIESEQKRYNEVLEKSEQLKVELERAREDEVWKSSEMQRKIEAQNVKIEEQEESLKLSENTISELRTDLSSAKLDIETWKNKVRNLEKQIFTYKAERASMQITKDTDKKRIKDLQEALQQALSAEKAIKEQLESVRQAAEKKISENVNENSDCDERGKEAAAESISRRNPNNELRLPLCPEEMDDFDDYFIDNLKNIGFNLNDEGANDFVDYLEKIIFHGLPLLIKRGPGINIANSLSNTLYGVPFAARLLYTDKTDIQIIDTFLMDTPDRVVCLDGFIGNCNVLELIPVLGKYRNKIIILTYMFDKTLAFVPNEILSYVYFIDADIFNSLLRIIDITEEPSEIKEREYEYKGPEYTDLRLQKVFNDIACECGFEESVALDMSSIIEDEKQLNEMLMFTLLPYVRKVLERNQYNYSKRLQRYAGESGRCIKKDIIMRWFGD